MTGLTLRVGTRASALALAQAGWVADQLAEAIGARAELVHIRTEGDANPGALAAIGGAGLFVTAVRAALLAGEVDIAVHSLKDLPTAPAAGLSLAAVPRRENPADALCARDGRSLADLTARARVGTGSPRRMAMLRRARPDLEIMPIRGNVDTRLGFVASGRLDAVVLAAAGLIRLGRSAEITELLDDEVMLPAAAQGALAVECRLDDRQNGWFASALAKLDDPAGRAEVTAERNLLATLEAGCSAPVGARARADGTALTLAAMVIAPDGGAHFPGLITGRAADAARLGTGLAQRLLADGATAVLGAR